jgi:hypothetical protein
MGALHLILGAVSGIAREGGDFGRWQNMADARAGGISLTGIGAVFAGLVILFGFMTLLGWFFSGRKPVVTVEVGSEPAVGGASGPDEAAQGPTDEVEGAAEEPGEPEEEPFVLPETPPHLVPSTLISGAALALHLYDEGALALGQAQQLEVDGLPRKVVLLAVGTMNRARVDGEEIVFSRTRIAPEEAA